MNSELCKVINFFVKPIRDLSIYAEIYKTIQSLVKQFRVLIVIPSFVKLFVAVKRFKDF